MQTALSDPREDSGLLCLCSVSVSATDAGGISAGGAPIEILRQYVENQERPD